MAKVGDIFKFVSAKVASNIPKPKFHVAIDLNCGFLLFINSDNYPGAMRIDRADWPGMPKLESYISCSAGIRYSKTDLKGHQISPAGALSEACLRRLRHHIFESQVMPQADIEIAVGAIDKALP